MTPLAAALAASALTAAVPTLAALLRPARPPPPATTPPAVNPSVVVHEAGHAVLAWHCTAVAEVLSVNVRSSGDGGRGGHVRNAWLSAAPQPAAHWCRLVVALGGVAAEMMVLRRARSGPASEDLMEAAALCRSIVQAGGGAPPWPPPPERALAFERVFVEQLTEQELRVMRTGYATARAILSHRSESLARLVALLFYRPVVRGEDLHPVLGPRPVASTSLWITLSDEVRAEFTLPPRRAP